MSFDQTSYTRTQQYPNNLTSVVPLVLPNIYIVVSFTLPQHQSYHGAAPDVLNHLDPKYDTASMAKTRPQSAPCGYYIAPPTDQILPLSFPNTHSKQNTSALPPTPPNTYQIKTTLQTRCCCFATVSRHPDSDNTNGIVISSLAAFFILTSIS